MIVSFHSFLRGTGKSTLVANAAVLLALQGRRVGVIDTAFSAPGLPYFFGLDEELVVCSLNQFLAGHCDIDHAVYDVTPRETPAGKVFLIPASIQPTEIASLLRRGYDLDTLNDGLKQISHRLELDLLVIDTEPGMNEGSLALMAVSDAVGILMRLDKQDYQGTSVILEVAQRLGVPRLSLVVNMVPDLLDPQEVADRVRQSYAVESITVLPHAMEMLVLASRATFVLRYPDHPLTALIEQIGNQMVASEGRGNE